MDILDHFRLMSQYNRWMNRKCYAAAATLPAATITADRGAFFKSILGTLNHLYVVDLLWLRRFAAHPAAYNALEALGDLGIVTALDQQVEAELAPLDARRQRLDQIISDWTAAIQLADLDHMLSFRTVRGDSVAKYFGSLIFNLFNHQTHHRGQLTTLLTQAGADVEATDLYELIPEGRPG
jgi:uncharacterized damage-inducible protein DinB